MNKSEVIGKLEALLGRVRSRAVRGAKSLEASAPEPVTIPPPRPQVVEHVGAVELPAPPEPVTAAEPLHEEPAWPTEPPPPPEPPFVEAPPPVASMDSDAPEVEEVVVVWGETTLLESESEIEQASDAHDSRERLVAAEPVAADVPEPEPTSADLSEVEEELTGIHIALPEPPAVEPAPAAARASEPPMDVTELDLESSEEEPPISSRRVVSAEPEERLAEMAFGADELPVPIHTPPPESGRLPASPGGGFEIEPELAESGRLPASPPGTFEADPDFTAVRSATPLLPLRSEPPATMELVAQATEIAREPSDQIVDVIAQAQAFAPPTFIALLDASLGL